MISDKRFNQTSEHYILFRIHSFDWKRCFMQFKKLQKAHRQQTTAAVQHIINYEGMYKKAHTYVSLFRKVHLPYVHCAVSWRRSFSSFRPTFDRFIPFDETVS